MKATISSTLLLKYSKKRSVVDKVKEFSVILATNATRCCGEAADLQSFSLPRGARGYFIGQMVRVRLGHGIRELDGRFLSCSSDALARTKESEAKKGIRASLLV